jgi:RNA polymerase sigma factor (sigma-70 family)
MGPHVGTPSTLSDLFAAERLRLLALAYRLTGTSADAEDVVADAFARLLARPPGVPVGELRFYLVRIVTNLAIDTLRRRKRRAYVGPWLPSPVELEADGSPDARYEALESVTFAFLLALEALGPRQRAVLVLRDVLELSAAEVGRVLDLSEANVRAIHLRARRAMASYDQARCIPTVDLRARHQAALEGFLGALLSRDAQALERLLADSARTITDAGGEFTALGTILEGRDRVARFYLQATKNRREGQPRIELRELNGLPAAVITLGRPVRRQAPVSVLQLTLDDEGRITSVLSVLAPGKLGTLSS